jgi:RimJ/RimL family protein N-acetyltransferase
MSLTQRYVSGPAVVEWVSSILDVGDFGPAIGIGTLDHNDELIAGVLYNGYTKNNICMHIASNGSRRWMTKAFLWMCFDYPFSQLGCTRVTGLVDETNLEAQHFNERLGFTLETRLEKACEQGDLLIYRMWRHECRFLTGRVLH